MEKTDRALVLGLFLLVFIIVLLLCSCSEQAADSVLEAPGEYVLDQYIEEYNNNSDSVVTVKDDSLYNLLEED